MTDKLLFAGDEPYERSGPMKAGSPDFRTGAILLVAGSRRFNNAKVVYGAIDDWIAKHGRPKQIIAGESEGVDLLAKMYASAHKIEYTGYPANWLGSGRQRASCGPKRNTRMLAVCTHVLALPSRQHSPGTNDTIRKARSAGKPVTEIKVDT